MINTKTTVDLRVVFQACARNATAGIRKYNLISVSDQLLFPDAVNLNATMATFYQISAHSQDWIFLRRLFDKQAFGNDNR